MAQSDASPATSQAEYRETPYEDATWEVVGEPPGGEEFTPLEVPVIKSSMVMSDPMFQDFGGYQKGGEAQRWHLADHLSRRDTRAKDEADAIEARKIKLMPEELEALTKKAFQEGRQKGIEESISEQAARLSEIETRLSQAFVDLRTQLSEHLQSISVAATGLAVDIGKKLIGHAVEINPEYIIPIISEALALSGGASIKRIRVSAQDLEFIEVVGVAKRLKESDGTWQFVADESIRSGCVVETSAGEIDYELDRAWDRIKDNVLKTVRS